MPPLRGWSYRQVLPFLVGAVVLLSLPVASTRIPRSAGLLRTTAGAPSAGPLANGPPLRHVGSSPYLVDGRGRPVYLTGSHTWNDFQDIGDRPFDYDAFLDLLQRNNHSFTRLWVWEQARWGWQGDARIAPLPWARTGPGEALDGQPRFDLDSFNQGYFDRLRARVAAARDRGITVSVMLFQGWSVDTKGGNTSDDPWQGHPFNHANNVNGVDGDPRRAGNGSLVHTLEIPAVTAVQDRYVRKVVDTLNDLDNVLFEISNESRPSSLAWQDRLVDLIHAYEAGKPYQHPVWLSWPETDRGLWQSPADVVSPGRDSGPYDVDPPPSTGGKVVIVDSDHLILRDPERWVWKSFLRGLNPIYMDEVDRELSAETDPSAASRVRRRMGQTRRFAQRLRPESLVPRGSLASTGYALARPGAEYLVYLPLGGSATVDLTAAPRQQPFAVEWFNPNTDETLLGGQAEGGSTRSFSAPFPGEAVLYLVVAGPPATPTPPPTPTPRAAPPLQRDARYFGQTGFRIDDDAIWTYFGARGGADVLGYPVSRSFTLQGCRVQVFQRVVAQVCAGEGARLLNLLDPDVFPYTRVNGSTFPAPDDALKASTPRPGDAGYGRAMLAFIRANVPDVFEGQDVGFARTFFGTVTSAVAGTADENLLGLLDLEVWGAPISRPARDPNNADFVYQRFQRGILHRPLSQGVTRGVLLADYLKAIIVGKNLPTDLQAQAQGSRYYAQYCPGVPGWVCRPAELPATDLTFAFDPD